MTATILRAAARLLRERAGAATPGPWVDGSHSHPQSVYWPTDHPAPEHDDDRYNYYLGGHVVAESMRAVDRRWITLMHPGVGLALADWLDTAGADLWAHGPLCCDDGCHDCDDLMWMPHARRALTLARLILGEGD